jgi:hypothetical protein
MRSLRRLRPYLHYLRRELRVVSAAVGYGILFGVTSGLGLPLLINFVFPPVFDHSDGGLPLGTVILIASAIPLAFMLRAVSGYLNSYYTQLTGAKVLEAIRRDYFGKLQDLPLSFIHARSSGDLISRGLADTAQLQVALTHLANDGLKQPTQLLGALAALVTPGHYQPWRRHRAAVPSRPARRHLPHPFCRAENHAARRPVSGRTGFGHRHLFRKPRRRPRGARLRPGAARERTLRRTHPRLA